MNRSMWRTAVLGLAMLIAVPAVSLGQRRGGSRSSGRSSRSFGGSRKSAPKRSAPKRNFGGSKSKPKSKATTPKSGFGGSKAKSGTKAKAKAPARKPLSKTDKAAFAKAKKSGTAFKSRKAAAADFKTKNAGKYPSKYTSKPATRPSHIPQSASVGGNTYNISYNAGYGGYGYMGAGGSWMVYSAMADAVMMNTLMTRRGYVYGPRYYQPVAMVPAPYGFMSFVWSMLVFAIVVAVIIALVRNSRRSEL